MGRRVRTDREPQEAKCPLLAQSEHCECREADVTREMNNFGWLAALKAAHTA